MLYSESLTFVNSSGQSAVLSDAELSTMWEMRNRSGFTAPDVELIKQKYVNGINKVFRRIVLPRTVRMNFVLIGETTVERDQLFADLVNKLMNVDQGVNGKLYVTTTAGTTYILNCAYSAGLNITDEYRKFHRFTLEFYAEDPYFYSEDVEASISIGGDEVITLAQDLYLGGWALGWARISGTGYFNNPLGRIIDPVFRITGSRTYLKITQVATGKVIEFTNLVMQNTDTIVIDTRERYKTADIVHADGSKESILGRYVWNNVDMSMPLPAGSNAISVESLGEPDDLEVILSLTYLSV